MSTRPIRQLLRAVKVFAASALLAACAAAPTSPPASTPDVSRQPADAGEYRFERTDGGDVVVDLRPPRARSYYELRLGDDGRVGLVPRPDEELAAACAIDAPLNAIARRAELCDVEVSGTAFVARINRLSIADALTVKRTLERSLVFRAGGEEELPWIWPPPRDSDVQVLCARSARAGLSAEVCEYYSAEHRTLEARVFTLVEYELLARLLNELYE